MFKPNFRYTDKIVSALTQIAAARELVLNSPFIPKWEVSLRRMSILWGQTPKLTFRKRAAYAARNRNRIEQIIAEVWGEEPSNTAWGGTAGIMRLILNSRLGYW